MNKPDNNQDNKFANDEDYIALDSSPSKFESDSDDDGEESKRKQNRKMMDSMLE
jgi:hypothetical protein